MQIDNQKAALLWQIMRREPSLEKQIFSGELDRNTVGCHLISVYYYTDDLITRELITEFLHASGYIWLRKLITRDDAPLSEHPIASDHPIAV